MDRTERFYKIDLLIRRQGVVSLEALQAELEVSRATLMRDLQYLRERMDAPIVFDRDRGGYCLAAAGAAGQGARELPGLWFSDQEIHALLSMHQLVSALDAEGVLARHLQPMLEKLQGMLGGAGVQARQWMQRVRIVPAAQRAVEPRTFEAAVQALFERKRMQVSYYTRARRELSDRSLSPQRLVHYRNTWYLDAWCHRSQALRRFSLDAMRQVAVQAEAAREVPLARVERALDGSYGVFAGTAQRQARIRFDAEAAQWVAQERWHPQQQVQMHTDGTLTLTVPYADARELVMDVLRHGPHALVLSPAELVREVAWQLRAAAGQYGAG